MNLFDLAFPVAAGPPVIDVQERALSAYDRLFGLESDVDSW